MDLPGYRVVTTRIERGEIGESPVRFGCVATGRLSAHTICWIAHKKSSRTRRASSARWLLARRERERPPLVGMVMETRENSAIVFYLRYVTGQWYLESIALIGCECEPDPFPNFSC